MEALVQEDEALLDSIAEFCRRSGMAESTFGRRAVNDGKFVARLRDGARITPETLERVSRYMAGQGASAPTAPRELMQLIRPAARRAAGVARVGSVARAARGAGSAARAAAATGALRGAAAAPAPAPMRTSSPPTGIVAPSGARIASITPDSGAGISASTLSVVTSTSG